MHRTWTMAAITALAFLLAPGAALAGGPLTDGADSVAPPLPPEPVTPIVQAALAGTGTINVNASALNGNSVIGRGGDTHQSIKTGTSTDAGNTASTTTPGKHARATPAKRHVADKAHAPAPKAVARRVIGKAENAVEQGRGKARTKAKDHAPKAPPVHLPEVADKPALERPELHVPELNLLEPPSVCSMRYWPPKHH